MCDVVFQNGWVFLSLLLSSFFVILIDSDSCIKTSNTTSVAFLIVQLQWNHTYTHIVVYTHMSHSNTGVPQAKDWHGSEVSLAYETSVFSTAPLTIVSTAHFPSSVSFCTPSQSMICMAKSRFIKMSIFKL